MLQGDISKLPERGHFYFAPTVGIILIHERKWEYRIFVTIHHNVRTRENVLNSYVFLNRKGNAVIFSAPHLRGVHRLIGDIY